MNRRQFVRAGAGGALALAGARLWAASGAGTAKLLVVMLRGAYDGASLLVPCSSEFYYRARPTLAVPRPDSGAPGAAIRLDADWGLNAAVRDTLYPLYTSKQVAFIPFCGSSDTSRSHFQAQDLMEMGQAEGASPDYSSGFLNRLVQSLGDDPRAGGVAFTNNLTLAFKGAVPVPNVSLRGGARNPLPEAEGERIAAMYRGTPLGEVASAGIGTRREVSQLATEMAESARGAGPARAFGAQARVIARLMRSRPAYSIGFADVGGWDTHVDQGATQGALASNLEGLGSGLAAFAEEMGALWKSTVVVVMSEFGRTARENGSRGTDHGHGSTLWVLGGGIAGGKIAGAQGAVDEAHLYQGRDFPVLNDYRAVLAHLFARIYGLDEARIDRVLPGARPQSFGLI
jgi:uncharacterized protein (DUF1501 family)